MKHRMVNVTATVIGATVAAALLASCSGEHAGYAIYEGDEVETEETFGAASQAVAACEGDDLQYDFNGFAASLAVAIANELKRWDVATDFVVSNGKLQLSSTGQAMCGAGCDNVKAILALQEDATNGAVPFHSPSVFRSKLSSWYNTQMTRLTELATASKLQPGTYRIKNINSNRFMTVDAGSMSDNAVIEQWDVIAQSGAGDWVVSVSGTKHKFMNARSGKCLDLQLDSSNAGTGLVQRTCATSSTQEFTVTKLDGGAFALMTKHPNRAVATLNWAATNDGRITQDTWDRDLNNRHWSLQPVNGGSSPGSTLFKGMYALRSKNAPTKVVGAVDSADSLVRLGSIASNNDLQQWYAYPSSGKYQFINRRSGKCLSLMSDSATASVGQRTCANNDNQKFTVTALGSADEYSITTRYGRLLELQNAQTSDGTLLQQVLGPTDQHRRWILTPTLAGEPHRLTFSHSTNDGPCGAYKWYNITEPNGQPLLNPQESYIQLIFAGGKTTLSGADENPFIAQVVSGSQVAIDPSGYMLPGNTGGSGSCFQGDMLYDPTKQAGGVPGTASTPAIPALCCVRSNGVNGMLKVSGWSTTTFLCQ